MQKIFYVQTDSRSDNSIGISCPRPIFHEDWDGQGCGLQYVVGVFQEFSELADGLGAHFIRHRHGDLYVDAEALRVVGDLSADEYQLCLYNAIGDVFPWGSHPGGEMGGCLFRDARCRDDSKMI